MSHLHEEDFEGMDSSQNGVEDLQSVIKVRYFWFPLDIKIRVSPHGTHGTWLNIFFYTQYFIHY